MGRHPYGARCGQPPANPRPCPVARGAAGPAPPSGRPAETSTSPPPSRSPRTHVAAAPRQPWQSARQSATAAATPGGSAAACRSRGKEGGGGHGERRGVGGPGSSSWAPAATTPMTARFDQRLTTTKSELLANSILLAARDDQTVDASPPATGRPSVPGHSAHVRSSNITICSAGRTQ